MWDVTTGRTLRKFHGHIQVQQPFLSMHWCARGCGLTPCVHHQQRLNCVAFNKESTVLVSGMNVGVAML